MAFENKSEKEARETILSLVDEYYRVFKAPAQDYAPGDRINYAGRVFDNEEMRNLVDASLDFWLTSGSWTDLFEHKLAEYLDVQFCSFVNSGSSANLLAFSALTQPELGNRAIKPGDEVITVAAGFPTTVAPILQYGAVPVFVDITIPQYNIDTSKLEEAYDPHKTKAVMIAHTLGNPFDLSAVKAFCDQYDLWLIEDNCDALGSIYKLDGVDKFTGTIGDIGTSSFYPPHHLTTGEGGAVYTNNAQLHTIMRSLRDWGRDCRCPSGKDNFCGNRFTGQYGELPFGYDHKYVYSHFGFNLKATDLQAAIGCAQLDKFPSFVQARRENWAKLRSGVEDYANKLILPEPCPNSDPSWFGFLVTCQHGVSRAKAVSAIEESGVQTRMLFAGNITRHPCFNTIRNTSAYRTVGDLRSTDRVMNDSFWLGVYPGMTEEKIDRMIQSLIKAIL